MRWLWVLLLAPSIALAGIGTVEHDEGRTWNERSNKTENIDVGYDAVSYTHLTLPTNREV